MVSVPKLLWPLETTQVIKSKHSKKTSFFSIRTTSQETSRIRRPQQKAPGSLTIPDLPSVPLGYGKAFLITSLRIAY